MVYAFFPSYLHWLIGEDGANKLCRNVCN